MIKIINSKKIKFGPIANIICEEEQADNEETNIVRPNNIITYLNWRLEQTESRNSGDKTRPGVNSDCRTTSEPWLLASEFSIPQ